ncbi:hypothetical protein DENSPDRAFT_694795 [Dentipellis sp. KUC8613]|nr:hypothetical protein DENSPDRAFT_694795 [Dentipellis sp. KUC8613]
MNKATLSAVLPDYFHLASASLSFPLSSASYVACIKVLLSFILPRRSSSGLSRTTAPHIRTVSCVHQSEFI